LEIGFHKRQVSFLVVKTVKCIITNLQFYSSCSSKRERNDLKVNKSSCHHSPTVSIQLTTQNGGIPMTKEVNFFPV